ncbi:MAG: T9SS type A sorting domain-containing protein [Bacteroidia bacterium]
MKKLLLISLFISCSNLISEAKVWIVNNNSNAPAGQLNNINAAMSVATSGDTIYVVGSPTPYDQFIYPTIPLTFIGPGYRPDKDNPYSAQLGQFGFQNGAGNCRILGFILSQFAISNGGADNLEIAYNYFTSMQVIIGGGCWVHNNIFNVTGGNCYLSLRWSYNHITNNIFNNCQQKDYFMIDQEPGYAPHAGNEINNNLFLSSGGGYVMDNALNFSISNNIFMHCTPVNPGSPFPPTNCNFNYNLTYQTYLDTFLFGTNYSSSGINYYATNPNFINPTGNFIFDYPPYDFQLQTTSVGHNGGSDSTDIGPFGGTAYPMLNLTGQINIPAIKKLTIANPIVGINKPFNFHLKTTASAGSGNIVAAEYFFDTDSGNGTGIMLPIIVGDTLEFDASVVHGLALGNHVFGFRTKDVNGHWSIPEMRSFSVCSVDGPLASFDAYVSGYDVILNNTSQNLDTCHWVFSDGGSSNQVSLVHHFDSAGVFDIQLISINPCDADGDTMTRSFSLLGVNSIYPNSASNFGYATFNLYGTGFTQSTKVKLIRNGNILIPLNDSIVVHSISYCQCIFLLSNVDTGSYDLLVEYDTTSVLKQNAINIVPVVFLSNPISTSITGPNSIRTGNTNFYDITISNNTNFTQYRIPVTLLLPKAISNSLLFSISNPSDTSFANYDTISTGIDTQVMVDQVNQDYTEISFFVNTIDPNSYKNLRISIISPIDQTFWIYAIVGNPFVSSGETQFHKISYANSTLSGGCFVDEETYNCIIGALSNLSFLLGPEGDCIASSIILNLNILYNGICGSGVEDIITSLIKDFYSAFMSCSGLSFIEKLKKWNELSDDIHLLLDCSKYESVIIPMVINSFTASHDPNDKFGSTSINNSIKIQSKGFLNYNILFENVDTAIAAAQFVKIIDTLDVNNLDLSTFQLNEIRFGDTTISIPPGRKSFAIDIDLRPDIQLIARVEAFLNDSTGVATWFLISLDPLTMEPITDPWIGFLPPNDSTGRGQGSVSYSVKTKSNIATGTIINNKADVFFDFNAPVTTPTWTNIIDDLKPQSAVNALSPQTNSDSINVSWSGTDNGPAGVYAYNVYYNKNGGAFILWKNNTSLTSDIFVGETDSTYGFYSVAIDSALNVEDAPSVADASTTITIGTLNCNTYNTYQPNQWGSGSGGASGSNYAYLHSHFNSTFPGGLTLGACSRSVHFTSAHAITKYLPDLGLTPFIPNGVTTNPVGLHCHYLNKLVALTLNIKFDATDVNFNPNSTVLFKDLVITKGLFAGITVDSLWTIANEFLGCGTDTVMNRKIRSAMYAINNSWKSGILQNDYLACPDSSAKYSANDDGSFIGDEDANYFDFDIFPNPAQSNFTIDVMNNGENYSVELYNTLGTQVYSKTFANTATVSEQLIDIRTLPKGIYVVQIKGATSTGSKKLVVE